MWDVIWLPFATGSVDGISQGGGTIQIMIAHPSLEFNEFLSGSGDKDEGGSQ